MRSGSRALEVLEDEIAQCRACPRLVAWRESVASARRAAFREETYWGRPVPGFGDPAARIALVGLAPAAHGANRTGRIFTGDRSGDWLFSALHRAGLANRPLSVARGDGLELRGAWVCSAVRCAPPANRPAPDERDRCLPFLEQELAALAGLRVVVALGGFAFAVLVRAMGFSPRPAFAHGSEHVAPDGRWLVGCYHPSQQNTFTGRLTVAMTDSVLARALELAGGGAGGSGGGAGAGGGVPLA